MKTLRVGVIGLGWFGTRGQAQLTRIGSQWLTFMPGRAVSVSIQSV
jgi:hypothetical protein